MARHAGIEITPDDWMKYGRDAAAAREHAASRQIPGRALPSRRRRAGGADASCCGPARSMARRSPSPGAAWPRTSRAGESVDRGRHHELRQARAGKRRLPRPEGQPVRLRDHEDQRDLRGIPRALPRPGRAASSARRWCSTARPTTTIASTILRWASTRTPSW